jgi:hypothetical protein
MAYTKYPVPRRISSARLAWMENGIVAAASGGGTGGAAFAYTHDQPLASTTWTVAHNLGGYPAVTVTDDNGERTEGAAVTYVDGNNITIRFGRPFSGHAYLS